jgi:cation transport ATPase
MAFWVSLAFTIPITLISMVWPMIPALHALTSTTIIKQFSVEALLLWILATPVQFGIGSRFYSAAYNSLKHGGASMDVLIALGSSAAYFYSVVSVVMACYNAKYHGMGTPLLHSSLLPLFSLVWWFWRSVFRHFSDAHLPGGGWSLFGAQSQRSHV